MYEAQALFSINKSERLITSSELERIGRYWSRWEDNIIMDIKETEYTDVDWIHLVQDRVHWRVLAKAIMNLWFPQKL